MSSLSKLSARPPIPHMGVTQFFETVRLRRSMYAFDGSLPEHAARLKLDQPIARAQLTALVAWGLATQQSIGTRARIVSLTAQGIASISWGAPPPMVGVNEQDWAGDLVRSLAVIYGVSAHAILRGEAKLARARLCNALTSQGWTVVQIHLFLGIKPDEAQRSSDAWALRMRTWS